MIQKAPGGSLELLGRDIYQFGNRQGLAPLKAELGNDDGQGFSAFCKDQLGAGCGKAESVRLAPRSMTPFVAADVIQRVLDQAGGTFLKDLPPLHASVAVMDRVMGLAGPSAVKNIKTPFVAADVIQRVLDQAGGTFLKDLPPLHASVAVMDRVMGLAGPFVAADVIQRVLDQAGGTFLKDLPPVQGEEVEEIASRLREAEDEEAVFAINAAYSKVAGANAVEPDHGNQLALTIPFHDRYIRAALQLAAVSAYMTVVYVVGLAAALIPPLSAALWTSGYTPHKPKIVWKAVGEAYDRIFSPENNHLPPEPPKKNIW
ncbi:hypothetical protein [Arthrobacter sp. NPDC093139]|uniref:hypothetical protein n=1 Tax=Arthrobacter sp. NPDC093139 TaxID=3363945 RepID=UPI0038157452